MELFIFYVITIVISLASWIYEFRWGIVLYNRKDGKSDKAIISLMPIMNLIGTYFAILNVKYMVTEELLNKNKLSKCKDCLRLSRAYQMELKQKNDTDLKNCPHCDNGTVSFEDIEIYRWQDTHPDCVKLDKRGLFKHIKTLKEVDRLGKEINEIDSFREYCGL